MSSKESAIATSVAKPRAANAEGDARFASLRARTGGYAVDMVILAAITMVASIATLFFFLWATDYAEQDPTTAETILSWLFILAGVPLAWTALNVALLMTRQQTGGQYVAALRVVPESGGAFTPRTALAWWFAGNPLLFSWPMAFIAGFPLLIYAALTPGDIELALPIFVILLCLVLPVVAVVSALRDERNRALHDRIAGVVVVPA